MGDRGPSPDADQAAKGFPGRRRTKAVRAADSAKRVAELLAPAAVAAVDLPAMLRDPKYEAAARVWGKLAPELRRTHRLPAEAEFAFTQFCIYAQEWVDKTEDLHLNGFTQFVKAVAGGKMERRRPQSLERQQAYANIMDLSGRFGLTPGDMYSLFKDQAGVATRNPGLFGEERKGEPEPAAPGRVGSLDAMRSAPPTVN
jgi:phage terminase small subunit